MHRNKILLFGALTLGVALMIAGYSRPYRWWPINDMAEQVIIKPFNENAFLPVPEGAVAVEDWEPFPDRMTFLSSDNGVKNPFEGQENSWKKGQELYEIYCISCHGKEANAANRTPVMEKGMPGAALAAMAFRNDAYLYGTLTHGSAIMNRYSFHLSPEERWHLVSYIRHLETKNQ